MPAQETSHRYQKAVLWPAEGRTAYNEPILGDPEQLNVQWKSGRRQSVAPDGTVIAVDATVVVDRDIPIGSIMREGELKDLPAGSQLNVGDTTLMEVLFAKKAKDVKGRAIRRTVSLARFKDRLPSSET